MRHAKTRRIRTPFSKRASSMNMLKLGVSRYDFNDPYHFALTLSWPGFFVVLVLCYLLVNLLFAALYWAHPGSIAHLPPDAPMDAFFFSVETLSTVGYGAMSPATHYGHWVVTAEIFVGMLFTATTTGLVFVRFSKPKAKILFAHQAVVARQRGRRLLMLRIGNGRVNALTDTVARLTALVHELTPGEQHFRRAVDLKLVRSELPFFPLTWTLIHELDETSPLHAALQDPSAAAGVRLMLSITARDPSLGAQVHAAEAYRGDDIAFGMRYADAITWEGGDHSIADMRKISDIEPEDAPVASHPPPV